MSSSIGTICFSFIAWCTRFTDNIFDETDIAKRLTTTPANQDLFHWLRLTDSKSPGACLITEQPSPYRRRVVLGEPSRNRWLHANARARACEPKAYALLTKANFSANYRTSQIYRADIPSWKSITQIYQSALKQVGVCRRTRRLSHTEIVWTFVTEILQLAGHSFLRAWYFEFMSLTPLRCWLIFFINSLFICTLIIVFSTLVDKLFLTGFPSFILFHRWLILERYWFSFY